MVLYSLVGVSIEGCSAQVTKPIIESLMNLNYLYNQLLKKLRNLKSLFKDIKEDFGMFRDGIQPVLTGTRCINQCIQAMGCVIDKFGLYTCYI